MKHRHSHGPRSIDRLAYQSGMRGWNPMFKTVLAVGTLILCLAADRPAVSAAVIVVLAALQKGKGKLLLRNMPEPETFLIWASAWACRPQSLNLPEMCSV